MERVKQNVKDVRKCLRYNLQLFWGDTWVFRKRRVWRRGSVLIAHTTRTWADVAALSSSESCAHYSCSISKGGVKAASAGRTIPTPTHYHLLEKKHLGLFSSCGRIEFLFTCTRLAVVLVSLYRFRSSTHVLIKGVPFFLQEKKCYKKSTIVNVLLVNCCRQSETWLG